MSERDASAGGRHDGKSGAPQGDYEVGRGRPPVATQFKAGQSGNPKGRPKASKNLSTLTREKLQAKVPVREGGRERRMTKAEIGVTKMVNRFAETGDPKLFSMLLKQLESSPGQSEVYAGATSVADVEEHASREKIMAWLREQSKSSESAGGFDE